MNKTLNIFCLAAILFFACSGTKKNDIVMPSQQAQASEESAQFDIIEPAEILEPIGAVGKTSWAQYLSAMQAIESEDPLTAIHYLDLALTEVYAEQQSDSLGNEDDSVYFNTMPKQIIYDLESQYSRLAELENETAYSMLSDFQSFDDFEETPLDSAEKVAIENFLDTIDLAKFSLPVVINERVMQEIHHLTVSARSFTAASLSRKTALDSMIFAKLRERNMPEDLIYLALVESGFKLQAYSRAKAAGVWQFIPATGKRYGLPVDFWVDMRRNPEVATDAALDYLTFLYKEFNDWHLAMAAYNCGEGRIRRLVRESRAEDSTKKVSYWDLQLPRETMHYVPRILAAAIIGHFPEQYAFTIEKQSFSVSDTATVKDCIPLDKVASAVGVSVNTMRDLNPELTRWCTPPNVKTYTLKVPQGSREKFLAAYAKMDKSQLVRWQQYKVQRGDNLGYISRQFGLKVSDIQAANNMKNTKLRIGQVLIIPMQYNAKISKTSENKKVEKVEKTEKNTGKLNNNIRTYNIRKGDNLGSVSRRYGVSVKNLMDWNNLKSNKVIVGQRLYLQDPLKRAQDSGKQEVSKEVARKSVEGTYYIVKSGDNLWDISRAHNITVQQLLDWNPGIDKKIYPGMQIKVKD